MTELEKILLQKAIKPTAMRLLVEKLLKQQYAVSHKELAEQFEKADNITSSEHLKYSWNTNLSIPLMMEAE
jgi:Fur family ferric uptake transcriptional regulator